MQLTRSDNITEQNICLHAEWLKYYFIHIFKFVPNKKKTKPSEIADLWNQIKAQNMSSVTNDRGLKYIQLLWIFLSLASGKAVELDRTA